MDTTIESLKQFEKNVLPQLIEDIGLWNTLDIDYHPPRVERLWTEFHDCRVYLHMIHPCIAEEALYHPHPWPSVMHILKGKYEMGIGFSEKGEEERPNIPTLTKVEFNGPAYYEMNHINGWHYVRPIDGPCYSIMITGKPWGRPAPKADYPLKPLTEERKFTLLNYFKMIL